MLYLVILVLSFSSFHQTDAVCTFPTALTGVWDSPVKGNLTFNESYVEGYEIFTGTTDVEMTFECHLNSGSYYIIRSENFTLFGGINVINAITCLDLTQHSTTKFSYYLKTIVLADAKSERVVFLAHDAAVTINDICNETASTQEVQLLLSYGTGEANAIQCPDAILGTYYYVNHATCNASYWSWDVCANVTNMVFNYTQCSDVMAFSAVGNVYCLYAVYSGSTAIYYVYNTDASVDNSATYRYTCLMTEINNDGFVYTSMYPLECLPNMTTTYVSSGGKTQVLGANVTCVPSPPTTTTTTVAPTTVTQAAPEPEETSNAGLVAGLVILFLILIAAAVVGGFFLFKKKFKKVSPNVIDSKEKTALSTSRSIDPVTPSVVDPEFKSPPSNGSHGKRYHKRIPVKRVERRDICTPPVDTKSRLRYKRFGRDEMTLITPNTLQPITSPRHLIPSTSPLPPLSQRTGSSYKHLPKVPEAPTKMKLELPEQLTRESTAMSVISRATTLNEESIGLRLLSENSMLKEKTSARKSVRSVQSNVSDRKVAKVKTPLKKSRPSISLTVKPLKNSKALTVKRPRDIVEFKDATSVYRRKKVKLVGKRQTPKVQKVKLRNININSLKTSKPATRPASKESMLGFDLVKELKHPDNQFESKNEQESSTDKISTSENLQEPIKAIADDGDDNFFMCSNYEEEIADLGPFIKQIDSFEFNQAKSVTKIKSIVETRKTSEMKANPAKEKKIKSGKWDVVREMERVAKTSFVKPKEMRSDTNMLIKAKKEAVIEQKVLSRIYYNYDLKTKSKIRQRRRRNRRTVDLSRMNNFERIPTLINWVEYTDILATPAMAMQKQMGKQSANDMSAVEIANQRYTS